MQCKRHTIEEKKPVNICNRSRINATHLREKVEASRDIHMVENRKVVTNAFAIQSCVYFKRDVQCDELSLRGMSCSDAIRVYATGITPWNRQYDALMLDPLLPIFARRTRRSVPLATERFMCRFSGFLLLGNIRRHLGRDRRCRRSALGYRWPHLLLPLPSLVGGGCDRRTLPKKRKASRLDRARDSRLWKIKDHKVAGKPRGTTLSFQGTNPELDASVSRCVASESSPPITNPCSFASSYFSIL